MRIGVDIDGVIADTFPLLIREMNDYFRTNIKFKDIDDYNIFKIYGITKIDMYRFVREREEILISQPAVKDNADKYLKLLNKKHTICIISARKEKYLLQTRIWLQKHHIPFENLLLIGQHDKRETSKRMNIALLLEDNLKNACQVSACGIPVILLDAPYNKGQLTPLIRRSQSWQEVYKIIENPVFNVEGKKILFEE